MHLLLAAELLDAPIGGTAYDHLPPLEICRKNEAIAKAWAATRPDDNWRYYAWWHAATLRNGVGESAESLAGHEKSLREIIGDADYVRGNLPCPFEPPELR